MWAAIFKQPEIRAQDHLRRELLNTLNYEAFYDRVLERSKPSDAERRCLMTVMRRVYEEMHQHICGDDPQQTTRAASVCRVFLSRFAGQGRERGFFFTLNQDLFLEHFFGTIDHSMCLPGLHSPRWFNLRLGPNLDPGTRVSLPDDSAVEALKVDFWSKRYGNFVYIKLHGSLGWIGRDGADVMVVGQTKSPLIKQEPLLHWYLSLFKEVLKQRNVYLVTIGYGFGDSHINGIIADAIQDRDCNLRLCVVSPEDIEEFHRKLKGQAPRGHALWPGLYHYCQARPTELYDPQHVKLPPRGEEFFRDIDLKK